RPSSGAPRRDRWRALPTALRGCRASSSYRRCKDVRTSGALRKNGGVRKAPSGGSRGGLVGSAALVKAPFADRGKPAANCCGRAAGEIWRGPIFRRPLKVRPPMLQFFRNFFKSKFGVIFTIAFLIVIAIAFGMGDVASNRSAGGVTGGDQVAVVGGRKISAGDLSAAMSSALETEKQQNPTLTMEAFIASGGMNRVLDQM